LAGLQIRKGEIADEGQKCCKRLSCRFSRTAKACPRCKSVGSRSRRQAWDQGVLLKQRLKDKLVEHRQHINKNGWDLPGIRNWKWGNAKENGAAR